MNRNGLRDERFPGCAKEESLGPPIPGFRPPEVGSWIFGSVAETETETVTESETVTGFTWSRRSSRPPDSGPRTPDCRTGSDTATVTATDTDTDTGLDGTRER